jgi:hypothetical protein
LNRSGLFGRRTITRVVYGTSVPTDVPVVLQPSATPER